MTDTTNFDKPRITVLVSMKTGETIVYEIGLPLKVWSSLFFPKRICR